METRSIPIEEEGSQLSRGWTQKHPWVGQRSPPAAAETNWADPGVRVSQGAMVDQSGSNRQSGHPHDPEDCW